MKCIDCKHCFKLYDQCKKATDQIKQCEYYEKIKREVFKNEDAFYNNISILDTTITKL